MKYPCSPRKEIDGLVYFSRLAEKARLHHNGDLHPDLRDNLGKGMDLWTCQFLGVTYDDLQKIIITGASDQDALAWVRKNGTPRDQNETAWWNSFMRNRGYRDDFSEKLAARRLEKPQTDRPDIQTFFDYLEADEASA